jgi:beta-N-acetylhexosaminidase
MIITTAIHKFSYSRVLLGFLIFILFISAQKTDNPINPENPVENVYDLNQPNPWVDSILKQMTLNEKIGQLFMVPAYSNKGAAHKKEIAALVRQYHIGGIIFMQGGPAGQVKLVNYFQSISKVPLLMAMDAEWGLGMRLDSTHSFPRQLTLGAIKNPLLIREMGAEIARQCKRVGIQVNFAPVIDINNNINNPVINDRSFGENRYNVALRGIQYMKGLQENGVMACAKHFPGHGDTDKDSHKDLPVIRHGRPRLDSIELFPFRLLAYQGVMSMMTAHLYIPALEKEKNLASSLSKNIVTGILKDEFKYKGLIFTDALSMAGATEYQEPGELELKAILAGNDILLFPQNISKTVVYIKQAIENGTFTENELNARVRKILNAKYWAGLPDFKPLSVKNIYKDLNNPVVEAMHYKLLRQAVTLLTDDEEKFPLQTMDDKSMATLTIGSKDYQDFLKMFEKYAHANHFRIRKNVALSAFDLMIEKLAGYKTVVIGLHNMSRYNSKNFGITQNTLQFLQKLKDRTKVIVVLYGSPYALKYFNDFNDVIVAYEDTKYSRTIVPQVLFGGLPARGIIPVTGSAKFAYGSGVVQSGSIRFSYGLPEEEGLNSEMMQEIDRIANEAILEKATPGCQVLIARNGKVVYEKNFGFHTYDKKEPVQSNDLYDIASITKIAGSTLSLMYLYERGKIDIDNTLDQYLSALEKSNLGKLKIRDVLTHTAGLKAWIPFYQTTIQDDTLYDYYYCYEPDDVYCVRVAPGLFMRESYQDSIDHIIFATQIKNAGKYKYSDLGFYIFKEIIEAVTNTPMDIFVDETFYKPMGLRTMTYNPYYKFPLDQIVPTEDDTVFRKQVIQGYVHDPGAAMMGGVSGHAGLFSDAPDLAALMQMLLNGGEYNGKRFLKPKTIQYFTKRQNNKSRRGLGFDKPETDEHKGNPACDSASTSTYGHTGFTGTSTWVDPEYGIVYVFLSNRVYPTAENWKLVKMDVRTNIQQVIYNAMHPEWFADEQKDENKESGNKQ